jgi:serine/threonine protein kinase
MEEFGNYYLLEKVAVGGMAELFKARQRGVHDFEKIVAIKRILPHLSDNDEFVRMFIDEAKLAAQLTHPNIVQIFDLGKAMGFYYIAMEFVDGRDLRSLLRKVREYRLPVPEAIAASVTMKVASALDYAHRRRGINDKELRLVHRDISPQNILISYDGAVKLVDFGIAKAATKSTQTMAGALKGKLLYMSPEQALGQPLDGRSDIYSLGLVLFELLTGERCFQADSELGVLEKVRMGKVQDVRTVNPSVSSEMAAIVSKALHKNVDQRYISARFLERDLKNLLVRTHSEPTEHDVAEYVGVVLKGARTDLEALLAHRYPEPVAPVPPPPAPRIEAPKPAPLPPPPTPALDSMETARPPFWLIPVVLAGIAAVAWVAIRMFK